MSSYFPKNGEQRGEERWDAFSKAWVRADEWQERQWAREDAAFARKANQGELKCPMILRDTMKPVQCQATGVWHDSKSELRKGYKRAGVIEVGNEFKNRAKAGTLSRFRNGKPEVDPQDERRKDEAMAKFSQFLDIGGESITGIKHDEDGMKRLRYQGKA